MSTVYKGQDLLLGRLVAVKVLQESLTGAHEVLERVQLSASGPRSQMQVTEHDPVELHRELPWP